MTDRTPMYLAACEAHANEQTVDADWAALLWADELDESDDPVSRARAEFVRVQAELGRLVGSGKLYRESPVMRMDIDYLCGLEHPDGSSIPHIVELRKRDRDLLRSHEDAWRRVGVCPGCKGCGQDYGGRASVSRKDCPECFGTGDLGGLLRKFQYRHADYGHSDPSEPVWLTWRCGLIDAVTVPRLEDVLEERCVRCAATRSEAGERGGGCAACEGGFGAGIKWQPTPWAVAVVRHHRSVTRLVVEELRPREYDGEFIWDDGYVSLVQPSDLPPPVYLALEDGSRNRPGSFVKYPTREAALDAAAVALCRVVRDSLKKTQAPADDTGVPPHGGS